MSLRMFRKPGLTILTPGLLDSASSLRITACAPRSCRWTDCQMISMNPLAPAIRPMAHALTLWLVESQSQKFPRGSLQCYSGNLMAGARFGASGFRDCVLRIFFSSQRVLQSRKVTPATSCCGYSGHPNDGQPRELESRRSTVNKELESSPKKVLFLESGLRKCL